MSVMFWFDCNNLVQLLMDATSVGKYFCPSESATEYNGQPWLSTFGCWSGITSAATVAVTQSQSQSSIITTLVLSTGIIGAYAVNVRSGNINDGLPQEIVGEFQVFVHLQEGPRLK